MTDMNGEITEGDIRNTLKVIEDMKERMKDARCELPAFDFINNILDEVSGNLMDDLKKIAIPLEDESHFLKD